MGHTSQSPSAPAQIAPRRDPYGLEAESAAREAETHGHATPPPRARDAAEADFIDARLVELQERERELADRERLIVALQGLLERSRLRLEERLQQLAEREPRGYSG